MRDAESWFICRIGYVETIRAVSLVAGPVAERALRREWPAFGVVEVDAGLVEHAAALALEHGLRSLDALHLAAALVLGSGGVVMATWDRRLHAAAATEGLGTLPDVVM